jgi:uncharacterized protein
MDVAHLGHLELLTPKPEESLSFFLLRQYQTLGLYNFAIAHAELPDDLVFNVVRVVFENQEEMLEANAAAAATVPANIDRNFFLPLHPGAIRYYRQIGKSGQTD